MFTVSPTNISNGIVPAGTLYSWSVPVVTGGLTGGMSGTGASYISGTLTNPLNTTQTATYTVTPLSGNCTGAAFTVTVTINPTAVVSDMTTVSCSGVLFTVSPTDHTNGIVPVGTLYTWSTPSVSGGLTGGLSGTTANYISGTLTNPTNVTQTATYTVTPLSGNCTGAAFTLTVTVNPTAVVSDMTTVSCSGVLFTVSPTNISNGIVPAGTLYSWSAPVVTGGLTGGVSATNQATVYGTLKNPTNITQTATYTVTPLSGSCTGAAFTVTVTINSVAVIAPLSTTLCGGQAFTITPTNGVNGIVPAGTTYTWTAPTGSGFTGGQTQTTGVDAISGTLTNTTIGSVSATYLVTPVSGSCTGSVFSLTVIINPVGLITPMSTTICSGVTFSVTPVNGVNGVVPFDIVYTWPVPAGIGFTGGVPENTGVSNISGTLNNITSTQKTAVYTITPYVSNCGYGTPFTLTVFLNPTAIVNAMTTVTCSGTAFTVSPTDGINGILPAGTTFSWSAPTVTGGLAGGMSGTNAALISGTLTNPTNVDQTAVYTIVPNTVDCGAAASFTVTVTVQSTPGVTPMSTTTCNGVMFTVSPTNISNGIVPAGTLYSWSVPAVNGGMTGGLSAVNAADISGTLFNPTNTAQTATYTVTPVSGNCTGAPFTVTVTVNPSGIVNPMTTVTCSGVFFSITPTDFVNGVVPNGTVFSWSAPAVTGGLTGGAIGTNAGYISGTLTNPTNIVQTATYSITPLTGNCTGSVFTLTVTVNPTAVVSGITAVSCSGVLFTVSPTNGLNGIVPDGTLYSWSAPIVTGGLTGMSTGTNAPAITGNLNNPLNTAQTATYTVTPLSGNCTGASFTVTVTVNVTPAISAMTTVTCSGVAFTVSPTNGANGIVPAVIVYNWNAPVVTGGMTGGSAATNASVISGTLTNPLNSVQTAVYTVTPVSANCTGAAFTVTVTVNPTAVINAITATTYSGVPFTVIPADIVNGIVSPGTTYSWSLPSVTGGVTGMSPGTSLTSITGTLYNPTSAQQLATYTVTPQSVLCGIGSTFTVTVYLQPIPVISSMVTTICSGSGLAITPVDGVNGIVPVGTTYSWSAPVVTGGITGGTSRTGSLNINDNLVNPTNTVQTAIYTVTPTSQTYTGAPFTVTVTVNPIATVIPMSGITCGGTAFGLTPVNGTNGVIPAGTLYTWAAPSGTGFSGGASQAVAVSNIYGNLTNTTNTVVTATYFVTPISGSCAGPVFTVTISINPTSAITDITTVTCSGVTFNLTPINTTNGIVPAGTVYTWSAPAVTGGVTGGAAGTDLNINGNLSNPTNAPQTAVYTVTPTSGSCTGAVFTLTVTVGAVPTAHIPLSTQTVCIGLTPTTLSAMVTGGVGSLSYQWYSNTANATTGGTLIPGATGMTFTPPAPQTTNTVYYYATAAFSVGGCAPITTDNTHQLNVNPYATSSDITAPAVIICSGLNAVLTAMTATTVTAPYFTWYYDANLTNQAGTGSTFTTGIMTNNTSFYVTVTGTDKCPNLPGTAKQVDVSVSNQAPVMDQPANQQVCNGSQLVIPDFTPATGINYNWSITRSSLIGKPATGSGNLGTITAVNNNIYNDTAVVTITPSANGCIGVARAFSIVVGSTPQGINDASLTVASNVAVNYIPLGALATNTYTWYAPNAIPSGITGAGAVNTRQSSFNPTLVNTTLAPIDIPFTVTPYGTDPTYCAGNTFTVIVTVNPVPAVPDQVATTCSGVNFVVSPTGVPAGTTYTWSVPVVISGSVLGAGAEASPQASISQNLTNTGTDDAIVLYTVTPVNGGFTGNAFSVTVTVHPNPVLTSTTPATICNATVFSFTPTSATAGTTFAWTRTAVNGIGNASASGTGNISETLVNTTTDPVALIYQYVLTANGCSSSVPQEIQVTVNPPLTLSSPLTNIICSNTVFNYTAASVSGAVLTWTRPAVNGISNIAAAGNTNVIAESLIDTTSNPVDVRYLFNITANGCTDTASIVVTVNPLPTVNAVADQAFCNGVISAITFTGSTVANTIYTWNNNNSRIGLINSGEGDLAFISTNTSRAPIASTVTVTPVANGCNGTAKSFVITVNPTPVLSSPLNISTICSGTVVSYSPTSLTAGTVFTWTRASIGGISNPAGTGTGIIQDTLISTANAPLQVSYNYTLTANGCTNTQIVRVIVNPIPKVANPGYQIACNNSSKVINFNGSTVSGTSYSWTNDNTAIGLGASGLGDIFFTAKNATTDSISANITVVPKANGCTGTPVSFRVTVNPPLALTSTLTPAAICSNTKFVYTPASAGTEPVYSWKRAAISGISNLPALGIGTISETLVNITASPILVTYIYTLSNNGCTNTQNVTVQVNPSLSLSNSNINNQACSNQPFIFTPISSITGVQYVWDRAAVAGITNAAASGTGAINETLINNTASPIDVFYRYSLGAGATCSNDQIIKVTVKPTPFLVSSQNITNCSNTPVAYTPIANIPGTSFNWSRSAVTGIANPSSVGLVGISESLINTTTAAVNVTYAYTMANSNGCTNTQNLTVQVKPAPVANFVADQSVCAGNATTAIAFTSNLSNTTYNWFVTDPSIGISSAFGTGNIPSFIAVNNATGQLTGIVQVTPSLNGCSGTTITAARITVNRAIRSTIVESAPSIACPGQTVGPFVGSIPLGGDGYNYTFQWQISSDSVNYTNIPGAVSRQLNYPGISNTSWFRMNTLSGGCAAVTAPVKVPLMPKPVITFSSTDGYNISVGNSTQVFASGGISYIWSPKNLVSDYTSASPRLSPVVDTRFIVYATNQEGCSDTAGVTITVNTSAYEIYPNNIVTPNGDGYNDTWRIRNIEYYADNDVKLYNTQGKVVWSSAATGAPYSATNEWKGTDQSGNKLISGTYYYVITLKSVTGTGTVENVKKGFVTLLN